VNLGGQGGSWLCGLTDGAVVPRVRPAGRGATAARGHAGLKVETTQTTGLIDPLLTLKGWPGCLLVVPMRRAVNVPGRASALDIDHRGLAA
jgi:hypothetical protein